MIMGPYLWKIRLRMAAQTQILVPDDQHLFMNGPVYLVAGGAPFAHGLVLPYERAALVFMASKTLLIDVFHRRCRPGPRIFPMQIMAIRAAHLAFEHRVMIGKAEFHLFLHMAGETNFRVLAGIDNIIFAAGRVRVDTARAMAHFATLWRAISFFIGDARMGGQLEFMGLFFMAGHARFRAHIRGGF